MMRMLRFFRNKHANFPNFKPLINHEEIHHPTRIEHTRRDSRAFFFFFLARNEAPITAMSRLVRMVVAAIVELCKGLGPLKERVCSAVY